MVALLRACRPQRGQTGRSTHLQDGTGLHHDQDDRPLRSRIAHRPAPHRAPVHGALAGASTPVSSGYETYPDVANPAHGLTPGCTPQGVTGVSFTNVTTGQTNPTSRS